VPRKPKAAARLTLEDVGAFAAGLPNAVVGAKWNNRTWIVNDRGFCWERALRKSDLARYGDETPPYGDIIAVSVENLDAKDALLGMELPGFFTIQHFNGYPAVLIELRLAEPSDVRAAIETAWRVESAKPPPRKRSPEKRKVAARPRRGAKPRAK
jgi:hypothetical protein